jgi:hypothetical protein
MHPSQQTHLGYSIPVYAEPEGNRSGWYRRFHICPKCLVNSDYPDVVIVQVPRRVDDRPKCYRCGIPLGMEAV